MSEELQEKTPINNQNEFQKSITQMGKITFIDIIKSFIISIVVFIFLGIIADSTLGNIVLQIILIIGFGYPLYVNSWGEGYRDLNNFEFNLIEKDLYRGFKFGLIALIPQFILSIILLISYFTGMFEMMYIYRLINIQTLPLLNVIVPPNILTIDYSFIQILLYLIIPPTITISFIGTGYYLGFKEFSIMDKIVYKKSNKNTENKK